MTTPSYNVDFLRPIVERAAGSAKQGMVEDFLQHVVLRGKAGGGGPSNDESGHSNSLHVTLPFKENGQIVLKTFVTSWFVYKLQTPTDCLGTDDADKSPECTAVQQPEFDAWNTFRSEIHAEPIRMALATWPLLDFQAEDVIVQSTGNVFLPLMSQ